MIWTRPEIKFFFYIQFCFGTSGPFEAPSAKEIKLAKADYEKNDYATRYEALKFALSIENLKEKLKELTIIDPFISDGESLMHLEKSGLKT